MKVYAFTPTLSKVLPDDAHLTANKAYEVILECGNSFDILDDKGVQIPCYWRGCTIAGGNWTRVQVVEPALDNQVKINTYEACLLARIDRDRFNEYVASGVYLCAPATVPGRTRLFGPDDLISLSLFSRMLGSGVAGYQAGNVANAVFDILKEKPNARLIACTLPARTGEDWAASDGFDVSEDSEVLNHSQDGLPLIIFDIEKERQAIRERMQAV